MQELVLILVIILLLFGGKKLPELSRGIGGAIKDIRRGFSDDPRNDNNSSDTNKTN